MELANLGEASGDPQKRGSNPDWQYVRPALAEELPAVRAFLQNAVYRHVHADWYTPEFWFSETSTWLSHQEGTLVGCLTLGADPPPAIWVRLAAIDPATIGYKRKKIGGHLGSLLERAAAAAVDSPAGSQAGALYWMSHRRWPDFWLPHLGFKQFTTVVTFRKLDLDLPPFPALPEGVAIRPALPEDFAPLAAVEAAAFAPLWRHSPRALLWGWRQSLSFDVAVANGRPIGFQHSMTASQQGAHLARITVHPDWQGRGVGSALLKTAFAGYARRGVQHVSLNTQEDNHGAQRLYRRLGFRESTYRWPLWERPLGR